MTHDELALECLKLAVHRKGHVSDEEVAKSTTAFYNHIVELSSGAAKPSSKTTDKKGLPFDAKK